MDTFHRICSSVCGFLDKMQTHQNTQKHQKVKKKSNTIRNQAIKEYISGLPYAATLIAYDKMWTTEVRTY